MDRPPRPRTEALLGRRVVVAALLRGTWAALVIAACYGWALAALPEDQARATAFSALILCNLGLLLAARRQGGAVEALRVANPVFLAICVGGLLLLVAALSLPWFGTMLRLARPPGLWLVAAPLAAAVMLAGFQLARLRPS
jgi:magnesium-transporting ATPase (P-type)